MDIEYFRTSNGRSPVERFINKQQDKVKLVIIDSIANLEKYGMSYLLRSKDLEKVKHYSLFELKSRYGNNQFRILGDELFAKFWMFHIFAKKDQKLKQSEIDVAIRRRRILVNNFR